MKQRMSHLYLQALSAAFCVLALCMIGYSAQAQVTTPYPAKTIYQMKNIQPDVQSWGTVGGSGWNANVSQLVGNHAGGIVEDLVWQSWEPTYPGTCTGSQISFEGHCFTVDSTVEAAIQTFTSQGLAVTGILYGTPSWANAGKSCASSEWCSPNNASDYGRFVRFIANRYNGTQGHGRVVDFVIDNEVDQKSWYNCGCSTNAAWEQDYANNFNAAYDGVKAEQTNARILMSFDHTWSPALDSPSQISVSEFIQAAAPLIGSRNWQIALHPYSIKVGGPTFSPDDINAGYTTFGDIGVIIGWLQQLYPGTAAASAVELTESGFDSNPANGESEAGQNTAVCNSFYNVVGTPGIDNYVYHRLIDNTGEGGLLLGLWDVNQSQKPSWATWALANGAGNYSCGFSANNYTTLTRSYNSSRGHWASSRLAPSGFSNEHSFNLLRSPASGTAPLYECQVGQGNMISTSVGCEGSYTNMGPVGYIHNNSASGLVALYRCHIGTSDHFISTNSSCEGQSVDYLLGYAAQIN
jgi:hypothetical protein